MVIARISNRGRITIPMVVLNALGLNPGDRLGFQIQGPSEVLLKPLPKSVEEVFGKLAGPEISKKSVADLNRAVTDRMRKQHQ